MWQFAASDFKAAEDRDLAYTHYQRLEQTRGGVPIEEAALRIWTDMGFIDPDFGDRPFQAFLFNPDSLIGQALTSRNFTADSARVKFSVWNSDHELLAGSGGGAQLSFVGLPSFDLHEFHFKKRSLDPSIA